MVESIVSGVCSSPCSFLATADKFHPVSIGIFGECNVPHPALGELLLEWIPGVLNSLARSLDVVHSDSQVSKTTVGFCVAIVDAVIGVVFGTVVVGEFENSIAVRPMAVTLEGRGPIVGEEVKGELVLGEVEVLDLVETQELVEFHYPRLAIDPVINCALDANLISLGP